MITFETEKDFQDAVMRVLYGRLSVNVNVSMEKSDDYYSRVEVPKVEVALMDSDNSGCITSDEDKAY